MFKKCVIVAFFALLVGCTSTQQYQNNCSSTTNQTMSSSFNEETYIWENWLFPSNKTTGK